MHAQCTHQLNDYLYKQRCYGTWGEIVSTKLFSIQNK